LTLDGAMVLFDCGEGTQVQFARAKVKASRLEVACITHFHGDHINGLPGFLSTLALNQHEKPVWVAGPTGLRSYFKTLRQLGIFVPRYPLKVREIESEGEVFRGEQFRITAREVDHRIQTWAFRFEENDKPGRFDLEAAEELGVPAGPLFGKLQRGETVTLENGNTVRPDQVLGERRPGRKVAYITDTRPCDAALEMARGVDLLIHEGTYGPEFTRDAHKRGHSTVVDAAELAKEAGARELVITHVSPKHFDIAPLVRAARAVFPNTTIARDFDEFVVEAIG